MGKDREEAKQVKIQNKAQKKMLKQERSAQKQVLKEEKSAQKQLRKEEKSARNLTRKTEKGQEKKMSHRPLRWDKLDNTALIFPVIAGEGATNVYRISVTLTEEIQPELLQKALDIVLPKFNGFNMRLRAGVFWYYFEENDKPAPRVKLETQFPCRYIQSKKTNRYLFRVSYYKCRINLEVFHVLADGMGGMTFIRELTYQYLRLAHPQLLEQTGDSLSDATSLNREDSFIRNYKKSKPSGFKKQRAYLIKLEKLPAGELGVMHGLIHIPELKEVARKYDASINEYLVGLFAWTTYVQCLHKMPSQKPIRIAVPVNLRPYFNSVTTKNFFVPVSAEFHPTKDDYTFEEVLDIIKTSLRSQIQKEHLEDLFSYSVSNQKNHFLRPVPLPIKNIVMRYVYNQSALANTTTITNVGKVDVDPIYEPYIKMIHSFIPMSKGQAIKGTINSYQDTLVFTFSSFFSDTILQREFFRKMAEDGVHVRIETNGVYDE